MTSKPLKQFLKEEVYIEHFDGCPTFIQMTDVGFTSRIYGSKLQGYRIAVCYFKERQGDWVTMVSDQASIGKNVIRLGPVYIKKLYARWLANFRKMLSRYYLLYEKDLRSLSNRELLNYAAENDFFYREKVSMPGFIDGFMFYADKRLHKILTEFCKRKKIPDPQHIFAMLSSQVEPSFINEEEADLLRLMKAGVTEAKLKHHLKKYSWIRSSYTGYKPYTRNEMLSEIARLKTHKPDFTLFQKNKKEKKRLIAKYKFTPEIRRISELATMLVKWQDQRKVYTLTYVTLKQKILEEVARRTNSSLELMRYCHTNELSKVLSGNLKESLLKEREKSCLVGMSKGKNIFFIAGKEARDFLERVSRVDLSKIKEISGMAANIGKARGQAKIMLSVKDIYKVKEGDILVVGMTRPEHLVGMRKAAAIVTDDGGITCHAAIVARELKKPCIIGTRIATKVLHDGDLVEVDAGRGIVRILKKAK